jgi:formiminotetrahydrofolate cyclodeaminase
MDVQQDVQDALSELAPLRTHLRLAAGLDAESFRRVMDARAMPRETEDQRVLRAGEIEVALKGAATVPLEIAGVAVQVLGLLENLAEIGNPSALSDAATGAQLALAAVTSARYNVLVNTARIEDEEFTAEHRSRADDLLERAVEITARVEALFMDSIKG